MMYISSLMILNHTHLWKAEPLNQLSKKENGRRKVKKKGTAK